MKQDGERRLRDICALFRPFPNTKTQVIAATLDTPEHVITASRTGVDIVTISAGVYRSLVDDKFTEQGLQKFLNDWNASAKSI